MPAGRWPGPAITGKVPPILDRSASSHDRSQTRRARVRAITPAGLMFLAITSVGWGFNWPVTKYLLSELPPLTMRGTTGVIGAGLLALLALCSRPEPAGAARAMAAAGAGGDAQRRAAGWR